jgi:cytochrome c oxidase assembly factor CtaG
MIGTVFLVLGYALATGPLRSRYRWGERVPPARQLVFYLGTLCMFLALIGPLDVLGDEDLFSAHMVQHMILSFVAPPLWLLGTPAWLIRRLVPRRSLRGLINPVLAFALFNGVMWVWHLPAFYDDALSNEWLHIGEHLMFMASGVIGFLPVLKSEMVSTMTPIRKLMYLVPAMFSCTALAALITLSSRQLYPFYGNASLGWGLTPLGDQQLGGLAMWLPGDMLYMGLIIWIFNGLLAEPKQEGQQVKV